MRIKINFLRLLLLINVYFPSLSSSNDEVFKQLANNYTTARNFMAVGSLCFCGGMIGQIIIYKEYPKKLRNSLNKAVSFTAGAGSALLTMYGITKYNLQYDNHVVSLSSTVASGCVYVLGQLSVLKGFYDMAYVFPDEENQNNEGKRVIEPDSDKYKKIRGGVLFFLPIGFGLFLCGSFLHAKLNERFLRLHFTQKQ